MNYTLEQVERRYRELPPELKDTINAEETATAIAGAKEKHYLNNEQRAELADEVGLVILGLEPAEELAKHLAERLQIDHASAEAIAAELHQQIFLPSWPLLQKFRQEQEKRLSILPSASPGPVEPPVKEMRRWLISKERLAEEEVNNMIDAQVRMLYYLRREHLLDQDEEKQQA